MQTIYLDISNKGVIPCIQAKQSEVGRKFLAVITDNGVPYRIPGNSLLSVWYEGDTDAGNYSSIEKKSAFSIDGNKVTVELVAQMLLKPSNGELCLSVTHGDGGETNTWNIPYCVEYKPGAGSSVPTEYYTALTEAGAVAAENATVAREQAGIARDQATLAVDSVRNVIKNVPNPTGASNATNKAYVDEGLKGKAPAGYGLGEYVASSAALTDANSAKLAGWYVIDNNTKNGTGVSATLVVDGYSTNFSTQTAIAASTGYLQQRHLIDNVWGEWEYITPPMVNSVEYRTTQRYHQKPVYTKLVPLGTLPNASTKRVAHNCEIVDVVDIRVIAQDSNKNAMRYGYAGDISAFVEGDNICIFSRDVDLTSYNGMAQIWYTKV